MLPGNDCVDRTAETQEQKLVEQVKKKWYNKRSKQ